MVLTKKLEWGGIPRAVATKIRFHQCKFNVCAQVMFGHGTVLGTIVEIYGCNRLECDALQGPIL